VKRLAFVIPIVLLAGALVFTGCAKPAPAPVPAPAPAPKPEPIVLKAVTFLPVDYSAMAFTGRLADMVNERANGALIIDWVGGPETIPMFEQPSAVKSGVVDLVLVPTPFAQDMVPEGMAFPLTPYTPREERDGGFNDFMNKLYQSNMNAYYLGRAWQGRKGFYFLSTKDIERPQNIAGRKAAAEPLWLPFLKALGTSPATIPSTEVYVALERGTVSSCIMPLPTAKANGYHEVVKYAVDHPFYTDCCVFFVNLDKWNQIPGDLQDLINQVQYELEPELLDYYAELTAEARKTFLDSGVEFIKFSPEDEEWFLNLAYEAAWKEVETKVSPESYSKLREILHK